MDAPSKKKIYNAAYALCEVGIATRVDPVLWEESKAAALEEVPDAPRRMTTKAPIWSTREVQVAVRIYESRGGRYSLPGNASSLLRALIGRLPSSGILGTSKKINKSESVGVLSRVLYLSPAWESGMITCPHHGACGKFCIGHSTGRMVMADKRQNRLIKTLLWMLYPKWFLWMVETEAATLVVKATGLGMSPAIRMNGSSDIRWERHGVMQSGPSVSWYDYTKIPLKTRGDGGRLPPNYHLTFSLDESPNSWRCAMRYLQAGHNVAIVVGASWRNSSPAAKQAQAALLERGFLGNFPVISGDDHDARFLDVNGHWIVLHAKGASANDSEGFVYRFDKQGKLVRPSLSLGLANRRAIRRLRI